MSGSWIEVANEALKIPGLLVEIYGDLAKPGVRQVGKALDTVMGLGNTVLWPITWANERSRIYLERNLEAYRERLSEIPEEKIIPVLPEIGVPIAEKLAYVADATLADLYINLLTKASSSDFASQAHPSFVNVINNLSPDEAKFLEAYAGNSHLPFLTAKWINPQTHRYFIAEDLLISYKVVEMLAFPGNTPAYISNLVGLGLIKVEYDRYTDGDSSIYDEIQNLWASKNSKTLKNVPERELRFDRGIIQISHFGKLFFLACHNAKAKGTEVTTQK